MYGKEIVMQKIIEKNKTMNLQEIYKELKSLQNLHEIEQEALLFCYEENKDYGHIFAIDTIYADKFKCCINELKQFINTYLGFTLVLSKYSIFKTVDVTDIPEYLAKSENWKEEYYQLMTEEYDEMMKESEEFKKLMDSGLIKYYVNGDSFTAKLAGKASIDIPITSKEVSETGEVSETEKTSYVLALDVSGSETVKMDLTNGNESYSMRGNMGINITLKDAEESVSFLEDQKLSNGDSIGISLSAKFSASIKDADVSLEKVSV